MTRHSSQRGSFRPRDGTEPRRRRLSWLVKHPLVTFFVLAYVFSWWSWIPYAMGAFSNPIVGFGPFLAAIVVLLATHGKAGLVSLLHRMGRWRVGLRWYAVALMLPAVLAATATMLNVWFGADQPDPSELGTWTAILPTFAILLLVPGIGGAWEEPGWRGYALPRLQQHRSPLAASLVLAALVAGWHLPLIVAGQVHYSDVLLIMSAVVVVNWVFNKADGSVLIVMILHAVNNAVSGSYFSPMFSGTDSARQSWLLAGVWTLTAVGLLLLDAGKAPKPVQAQAAAAAGGTDPAPTGSLR